MAPLFREPPAGANAEMSQCSIGVLVRVVFDPTKMNSQHAPLEPTEASAGRRPCLRLPEGLESSSRDLTPEVRKPLPHTSSLSIRHPQLMQQRAAAKSRPNGALEMRRELPAPKG